MIEAERTGKWLTFSIIYFMVSWAVAPLRCKAFLLVDAVKREKYSRCGSSFLQSISSPLWYLGHRPSNLTSSGRVMNSLNGKFWSFSAMLRLAPFLLPDGDRLTAGCGRAWVASTDFSLPFIFLKRFSPRFDRVVLKIWLEDLMICLFLSPTAMDGNSSLKVAKLTHSRQSLSSLSWDRAEKNCWLSHPDHSTRGPTKVADAGGYSMLKRVIVRNESGQCLSSIRQINATATRWWHIGQPSV